MACQSVCVIMDEQALLGLNPNADARYRHRAMAYFEQLKESQDGWEVCAEALAKGIYNDDHVKFFCFQVLEHQIRFRHAGLSAVQQQLIRETLMKWLQIQLMNAEPEKPFIRNKAAQVFALTFVMEYLTMWPKFFFDILTLVGLNPRGVDVYLRTLMAIDGEVVDRDILHLPDILQTYQQSPRDHLPVSGGRGRLRVLDRPQPHRQRPMSVMELREEACDCLFEIINKGMDPADKIKLVESLCQEEDVDFLAKFSRLVNGMGQSLVLSWSKLSKNGNVKEAAEALQALESKVPLLLRLLIHEDDDISANIVGFCYEYLHVLKQLPQLTDQQKANLEAILLAVMKKTDVRRRGEDEAMFVEYRKQLKMLLDRLAQVSPECCWKPSWQTASFMEVEVAVRLLYMLGEAYCFTWSSFLWRHGQDQRPAGHDEDGHSFQHSSVSLEFFETVSRYDKFFLVEPQHIPIVLMAFLDQRGLRHSSPKVRSRVAYLFSRFIKTLHKHMNAFIEDVLTRIQDLLELNPPENGFPALLTSDDQLFMFEAGGVLIVHGESPAERKTAMMTSLLQPLMDAFNAFSNKQTVKLSGCSEVYRGCLQTFLPALSVPLQKGSLRSAVRSFLHRMIICMEEEVLGRPAEENDQAAALEKQMLRRSYFTFIQTVAGSGMNEVMANQGAENIERVVFTIIQGAVDFPDPIAQKSCFIILSKLVELWGGKDGMVGFPDFIYKHIVPACFLAPLKPSFDLSDAQTVLTLSECAITLKTIHLKRGLEFIRFLQQEYLPSLQVAPEVSQELVQVLQQPDVKVLKNYMKVRQI
ncbi:hypothetical protein F7725_022168 [Dissostichus mawsoni]|uniref:Exportin-T n=1 Tax=Dissostichus mawsoni TaxID=36200 RepID=A0A7J5ZFI2_DISMA|nr:hypothetical protein F7725_022168 [Dissostichus mawsoni]